MPGLAVFDIRIILRGLAPIEAAIVAHDADPAVLQLIDAIDLPGRPGVSNPGVLPGDQQRHFAGVTDAGKDVEIDHAVRLGIQTDMPRARVDLLAKVGTVARSDLGESHKFLRTDLRLINAVLARALRPSQTQCPSLSPSLVMFAFDGPAHQRLSSRQVECDRTHPERNLLPNRSCQGSRQCSPDWAS